MRPKRPTLVELGSTGPLPASPELIRVALRPHLTAERLARIEAVASRRCLEVTAVLDNLIDPHNTAAILRSAEALGVHRVHVVAEEGALLASKKITRGADRWLSLRTHQDPADCVAALRREGYAIFVATMDGEHLPEQLAALPRVAIVYGNEHRGPSKALVDAADGSFRIPMRGFVESLNVSVAAAISLHAAMVGRGVPQDSDRAAIEAQLMIATIKDARRLLEAAL